MNFSKLFDQKDAAIPICAGEARRIIKKIHSSLFDLYRLDQHRWFL